MSENEAAAPQAGEGGRPQAGADEKPTERTQAAGPAPEPKDVKDLPEWAQKMVRDLRREAADFRTKVQQAEDRDKTELQKATERAAELEGKATAAEQRARDLAGRAAVYDAVGPGRPLAAVSAKAVWALAREALEYGDDGEPTNVEAVIARLRKDDPALFRASPGKGDGGAAGAAPAGGDMNAVIRRMAGLAPR